MSFKTINQWINEEEKLSLIVLYPGSFKPIHGGHIDLINKYIKNSSVSQLKLFIGPGIRDGIDQNLSYEIANILLNDINKIEVLKVDPQLKSPITTAYNYIFSAPPGKYAIASSNKGDDYKRVLEFVKSFSEDGKYKDKLPENVSVEELFIDINPLLYKGRNDEYENHPISASILRHDIKKLVHCEQIDCPEYESNLSNFVTNYPNIDRNKINIILDILLKHRRSISESYDLYEGGAAAHMKNIWEAKNLTFGNLKEIISNGLDAKIENISEKLDGQNLMCSFKNNKLIAARRKSHLKDLGETALDINGMKEFFGGRGVIEKVFVNAMIDLEKALKLSNVDIKNIFKEGKIWLNLEIIFPDTENVIPYGTSQLRLHHFREVDINGEVINITKDNLIELYNAIQNSKSFQQSEKTFLIIPTNSLLIKTIQNSNKIKEELISELNSIEENEDLTIQDYVNGKLIDYIVNAKTYVSDNIIEAFVKRWGENDKSISINKLLVNIEDFDDIKWFKETDKNIDKILKNIIQPIETIILKFSSTILLNLEGLASSNPSETANKIRDKVLKSIEELYKYIQDISYESAEIANETLNFLTKQLERLEISGGIEKIAPTEGIVFEYKGNLLKITGSFGPINQIIAYLKYGNTPKPIKENLNEGGNIFKSINNEPETIRIKREYVLPTIKWLETITDLPLTNNILGSAGQKTDSGDIDLGVDKETFTKEDLIEKLKIWCNENNLNPNEHIKKSGTNVHFKSPIIGLENEFVQIDFMFGDPQWMNWFYKMSKYDINNKAIHRLLVLISVSKYKGYKLSQTDGLFSKSTGEFLTKDPNEIAKILFGLQYTKDDLESLDKIMDIISVEENREEMLKDAQETIERRYDIPNIKLSFKNEIS